MVIQSVVWLDQAWASKVNSREPLPHEKKTIRCLSKYGFDVETIIPSNIPGSRNPDILMLGTFWEMKSLQITDGETMIE